MSLEKVFQVTDAYTEKPVDVMMQTSMGTEATGKYFIPNARTPYRLHRTVSALAAYLGIKPKNLICPYLGVAMTPVFTSKGFVVLTGGFDPSLPFSDADELRYAFSMRNGKATAEKAEPYTVRTAIIEEPPPVRDMPTQPKDKYMKAVDEIAAKRKRKVTVQKG